MIHLPDTLGDMHFKPTDRTEKPNYLDREWVKCGSICTRQVKPVQTLDMCPPVLLFKMSLYCRVNKSEIRTNNKLYHENSHLETSPWSPHGSDEGPAVLFGVITLYSPQTLLSVVASCRTIKIHWSYRGALGSYIFLYIIIFSKKYRKHWCSDLINYLWSAFQESWIMPNELCRAFSCFVFNYLNKSPSTIYHSTVV